MKIYLKDIYPTQFVYEYLPKVIIKYFLENMNKYKKEIEKYLQSKYNITINQFINVMSKSFKIVKYGRLYIISISNNYIDNIMRIIDYGNSEFKGLNLFNKSARKIEDSVYSLYLKYHFMK